VTSFRIATYNLWHGLSPTHWLRFETLEPKTRRKEREELQVEMLKDQNLDAVFLQEVNPVRARSKELAHKLEMQRFWGRDNAGVKIGSLGAPFNLDSGLSLMLSQEFISEWSRSIYLSGDKYSALSQLGALQWTESRYALLTSVITPRWGRVLFINTHLHHGLELRKNVLEGLSALVEEGKISGAVAEDITERIRQADERRSTEVARLLNEIEEIKERYSFILLGGDFNSTAEAQVFSSLTSFGFEPLQTHSPGDLKTYDHERNKSNFQFTFNFKAPILVEDLSFDKAVVSLLQQRLKQWEMAPRQIDFLYGWSQTGSFKVHDSHLFGEESGDQLAPSDHLGLASEAWRAQSLSRRPISPPRCGPDRHSPESARSRPIRRASQRLRPGRESRKTRENRSFGRRRTAAKSYGFRKRRGGDCVGRARPTSRKCGRCR